MRMPDLDTFSLCWHKWTNCPTDDTNDKALTDNTAKEAISVQNTKIQGYKILLSPSPPLFLY